jgi:NADH-quinone oxidoreductase subunit G
MEKIKLTIDGKEVETTKGKTVLEAARENGIDIPVFCYHHRLRSVGACRICLVEIEKWPKLQVSCSTAAAEGMVVFTNTPRVIKARQGVLEFILANHPLDCPTCDKGGECPLQDTTFKYGLDYSRFQEKKRRFIRDENSTFDDLRIGPEIVRNQNRCIHCYRCTRLVQEAFFEQDLASYERGAHTEILPPPGGEIRNLYSGNVVEYCPVGALTNTDWRYKIRVWKTKDVPTICRYCSDGCNLRLSVARNKIWRAQSRRNDSIDEGLPCDLGRYGYQFVHHADRLTRPMINKGGELVECSWDEALSAIRAKIDKTVANLGPQGVAGLVGESLSNEDYFAIGRFFKAVIGTNSIDHRISRKKKLAFSEDVVKREACENKLDIADLERADHFFIIGADLHAENPITALRILKARSYAGASISLLNPLPTHLNRAADREIMYKAYSEVYLIQGLARMILEKKLYDSEKIKLDKAEIGAFLQDTTDFDPAAVSEKTGITSEALESLAKAICAADNTVFLAGERIHTHYQRNQILVALYNLARLSDNLNGVSSGLLLLGGEANTRGCYLFGMRPDRLPFDLPRSEAAKLTPLWGEEIADNEGYDTLDILQKINEEKIECGFVIGVDASDHYPDNDYINKTLAKLEFLVVADLFLTDTARLADVVLPLSSHFEIDGSFVNWEGSLQKFSKAVKTIGESMPAWQIFTKLSAVMEKDFAYTNPTQIFEQIAPLLGKGEITDYNSIPSEGFRMEKKKSYPEINLAAVKYKQPSSEDLPFVILSGNGDHHFGRNFSSRSESLNKFLSDPFIVISSKVAEEMMISEGDLIKLENSSGKIVAKALIWQNLPEDAVFVPDNFHEVKVNMVRNRDHDIDRVKIVKM